MASYFIVHLQHQLGIIRHQHHLVIAPNSYHTDGQRQLTCDLRLTRLFHHVTFTSRVSLTRDTKLRIEINLGTIPSPVGHQSYDSTHNHFVQTLNYPHGHTHLTSHPCTLSELPQILLEMLKFADTLKQTN